MNVYFFVNEKERDKDREREKTLCQRIIIVFTYTPIT